MGVTGTFIDVFVPPFSGGLFLPNDLVFGPDGNLYVGTFANGILRYDGKTGAFVDAFVPSGSGGLANPFGLTFGPDGNLYVASIGANGVLRYNGTSGAFMGIFASGGGLSVPSDLIFGPDGNLYITSGNPTQGNGVLRYNGATGVFIDAFVSFGSGGLSAPRGLRFGPDGNLYVSSLLTNSALRYNGTTGAFIDTFVPSGSGGLNQPSFLTFTPSLIPFATFSGKVELNVSATLFDLNSTFTLGARSIGINPLTEDVKFQVGTFSTTIPAGSFQQNKHGNFVFEDVIDGVFLDVVIVSLGNSNFAFKAEGVGADLTGTVNPVTVGLTIGNNAGTTTVTTELE